MENGTILDADPQDGDRLISALNEAAGLSVEEADSHVREKLSEFVGDNEQYDDITTLCFRKM